MTKLGISLAALLVSASIVAMAQDMKPTVQNADQIRWADAPAVLPKGA